MNSDFEIITRPEEPTLEISACATMISMCPVIKKSFTAICQYLDQLGQKPSNPPFIYYSNVNWQELQNESKLQFFFKMFTRKWTMQIGIPVESAINGQGNIQPGHLPEGQYAQMLHKGAYQKVGDTYKKLVAEIQQRGLRIKSECLEIYLNDPHTTKTENLETLLLIPLDEST